MREQLAAKPQSGSHPSSPVALLHQTFPFAESPQCPQRLPGIANDHCSMAKTRTYFCIDMKSFYASVECAERGYNPFETNLVVADLTRGKNALCLAITPAMKAQGIRNRCRLSEIPSNVKYEVAPPRMALYIEYAADIYSLYLDYFDPRDIHVYSIDESFLDVTDYPSYAGRYEQWAVESGRHHGAAAIG